MKKTFFINGGAGRVLCSISALEEYHKANDDFIVIADGGQELFKGCSFQDKVFYSNHKNIFEDFISKCDKIETPEPYHLKSYITQKCSISAGFNMEINGSNEELSPRIYLSIGEHLEAKNLIEEIKRETNKDKVVFFQPFGSGSEMRGNHIFDMSSRSIMESDTYQLAQKLSKDFAVIVMSEFELKFGKEFKIAQPRINSLRLWGALIGASDYFIGCDSLGQHFAKALGVPATVILGATFPINVSYPNDKQFDIVDLGKDKKVYQPIRITSTEFQDIKNDGIMFMGEGKCQEIVNNIKSKLGSNLPMPKSVPTVKSGCCGKGRM